MNASAAVILAVCTLMTAGLRAQDPPRPTLHRAWLTEVMDLDVPAAAEGYRRVAADTRPGNLERWVAAARLLELRRCGAAAPAPPDAEAPQPLRETFRAAATPLPEDELLARAQRSPKEVLQRAASEAGRVPALRTAVPATEEWLLRQAGPNLRDRLRQRQATLANRGRGVDAGRAPERFYAFDILRAEIQGRTAQADALRALYFGDWRPPAATGAPETVLVRIRRNLAAWLRDGDPTSQQSAALRELSDAIDQRAANPATAITLVLRLPVYAERLLAETTTQPGR